MSRGRWRDSALYGCLKAEAPAYGTLTVANDISNSTAEKAEERFDRIIREHGSALARVTFGYEKVASAREELMQDIALAIWQALPHFRGECSERTFIFRIAHNRCLTHVWHRQPSHEPLDGLSPVLEPVDPRPRAEEQMTIACRRDRLRCAIQRLSLPHRQVILLMLEDFSNVEIAEVLGLTENNVAVRLNRARKALKNMLEGRL